jgi:hypothetical protein
VHVSLQHWLHGHLLHRVRHGLLELPDLRRVQHGQPVQRACRLGQRGTRRLHLRLSDGLHRVALQRLLDKLLELPDMHRVQ